MLSVTLYDDVLKRTLAAVENKIATIINGLILKLWYTESCNVRSHLKALFKPCANHKSRLTVASRGAKKKQAYATNQ